MSANVDPSPQGALRPTRAAPRDRHPGRTPRWWHALAVAALAVVFPLLPTASDAQQKVDADTVAAWVQRFHEQTRTFQASFYQTYYHALYDRYQRSKGTMIFEKPGKMRFDYARPNGKVIVSDGDELTVYEPGDDSDDPGQYVKSDVRQAALPNAFSFLTGVAELDDDFRYRRLDAERWGWGGEVLELRPREPSPHYKRILLFVDARPKLRGVVHSLRVDDHDGNRNKFELSGIRFNRKVDPSRFDWRPPEGARRVRM